MKIIRGFKIGGFILAAAFSAGLGFSISASAQVKIHTSSTSTARQQPNLAP